MVAESIRKILEPTRLHKSAKCFSENISVASAAGQHFGSHDVEEIVKLFSTQLGDEKSSLLVDLENGKPLEIPWLSGHVHQLGKQRGIATPANSAVWAALCPYVKGAP